MNLYKCSECAVVIAIEDGSRLPESCPACHGSTFVNWKPVVTKVGLGPRRAGEL